jgi:hypothetical protein
VPHDRFTGRQHGYARAITSTGGRFAFRAKEDPVVVFMAAAPGYIGQVLRVLVKNLVVASILD